MNQRVGLRSLFIYHKILNQMKKVLFAVALLATALGAAAGVLDLQSRARLRMLAMEQANARQAQAMRQVRSHGAGPLLQFPTNETKAFVSLAPGATTADLEAAGMKVETVCGRIAIVSFPIADTERLAACDAVSVMQLPREVRPHLDLARRATGVDAIHAGNEGLSVPYTGKGVFTGIVDQGVDPHHINFIDADGNNRVEYLSHIFVNANGSAIVKRFYGDNITDAAPLSDFVTDEATAYHGTHTLGIMAGGYSGNVTVADGLNGNLPNLVEKANPFIGMAPGSDIGVSCGVLNDVGIAEGIAYMLGYSVDYKHQPTVVNLSLGSNIGPHDKNSMMARFLAEMGKDAIICVSAGNEGDRKIALTKTFTATDNQIKSFVYPYAYQYDPEGNQDDMYNNTIRSGQIVFYSDDATPFELQAVIYRKSRGYRAAVRLPLSSGGEQGIYYATDNAWANNVSGVVKPGVFADNFYGYIGGGAAVNEDTGRYYAMVDMHIFDWNDNKASGEFVIGFEVKGEEGQRVECYSDGLCTWIDNLGVAGFDDGSRNGSISDMAVADNILVVGAFNTRQQWECLDGQVSAYPGEGFAPGSITEFSSFGTLSDGTTLPHVCAPGSTIISSISNPYLKKTVDAMGESFGVEITDEMRKEYYEYLCQARATVDGVDYYWKQEPGTSMSTPHVAGCIALWLEADPTLTIDDVKDIVAATAVVDDAVKAGDPVQWGAGKFNALAGLKEVIRRSGAGINGVRADENGADKLIVTALGENRFKVFAGGAAELNVALYAIGGTLVYSTKADGDEAVIDASALSPGIYVLDVNGLSGKLVVR